MKNYEIVERWAAGLNVDAAFREMEALKLKYPWLKCDETLAVLNILKDDLPKIAGIVKLQEKQNAIHKEYIRVNGIADTAITEAIIKKFNLDVK